MRPAGSGGCLLPTRHPLVAAALADAMRLPIWILDVPTGAPRREPSRRPLRSSLAIRSSWLRSTHRFHLSHLTGLVELAGRRRGMPGAYCSRCTCLSRQDDSLGPLVARAGDTPDAGRLFAMQAALGKWIVWCPERRRPRRSDPVEEGPGGIGVVGVLVGQRPGDPSRSSCTRSGRHGTRRDVEVVTRASGRPSVVDGPLSVPIVLRVDARRRVAPRS